VSRGLLTSGAAAAERMGAHVPHPRSDVQRRGTPRLSGVRHPLLGSRPRSLHGLRHGVCRGALLQVPRRLPLLQRSPHRERLLPARADHVIPPVPVRPWLISVLRRLRYFPADLPAAIRALTNIFRAAIEQAAHLKPEVRKRE
jgi:hypothetical protein